MDSYAISAITHVINLNCKHDFTSNDEAKIKDVYDHIGRPLSISGNLTAINYSISKKGLRKEHISVPTLALYGHLNSIRYLHSTMNLTIEDYCGKENERSAFDLAASQSHVNVLLWMERTLFDEDCGNKYVAERIFQAIRNNTGTECLDVLRRMYSKSLSYDGK